MILSFLGFILTVPGRYFCCGLFYLLLLQKDIARFLQKIALGTISNFNYFVIVVKTNILTFPRAINLYLVNCLSVSLKEMK